MRRALVLALVACVQPPIVQAPVTVVVQPAVSPCLEERVLVDDALQSLSVDAGAVDADG